MIVSLLALFGGTITFGSPGIRLELFLKELTKQTQVPFRCTATLNDEVIAASFTDQSIDTVKAQLAKVIHGTWEQKGDVWWLFQTSEQRKEEVQWAIDCRRITLKAQLDGLKAVAPKSEWTIQDAEKYWRDYTAYRSGKSEGPRNSSVWRKLRLSSPEARFCAGIATQLTPQMFISDPVNFNLARYSVRGLPGHIELPIDTTELTRKYIAERDLFAMVSQGNANAEKPAHLELRYTGGERPFLFFSWLNKDWRYIGNSFPGVYLTINLKPKGEVFPLSAATQRLVQIQRELSSAQDSNEVFDRDKSDPIFSEAIATMFDATKRDPLGIIDGKCWIDFSKSLTKPLLVNLKEDMVLFRAPLAVPTLEQPELSAGMTRIDADGWVLGRPTNPYFNRVWRLDRSYAEEYARLAKSESTSWYGHVRRSFINTYQSFGKSGIPSGEFIQDKSRDYSDLASVLGAAPEGLLQSLLNGARIPVTQLPQISQDLLKYSIDEGGLNELSPIEGRDAGDYCPLVSMPQGIRGITVGATLSTEPEFVFDSAPVEDYGEELDLGSMAYLISQSKPDSPLQNKPFKLGTKKVLIVTFYLGNKSKSNTLAEPSQDTSMPKYTWKNLPDAVRQQVFNKIKSERYGS